MSSLFHDDDLEAITDSVRRFRDARVVPLCARSDRVPTGTEMAALRVEAEEIGLLNSGPEAGFGLWEHTTDAPARALSVRLLRELAHASVGVAYHFHALALARFLARTLALACSPATVASLQGVWGLGRGALPRLLRGATLDDEERLLLADYFACDAPREVPVHAADGWDALLLPAFDRERCALSFRLLSRHDVTTTTPEHPHGLEETPLCLVRVDPAIAPTAHVVPAAEEAHERYAAALCVHAMGLLAIGTGALARAHALAREYAGTRTQGGCKIERHAAVQELLGSASGAAQATQHALDGLTALAPGRARLPAFLSVRAELQPRLCAGANDALQVFGGLGYMRDVGVERIVRDQNCLRVIGGTPGELKRFVAEWERA